MKANKTNNVSDFPEMSVDGPETEIIIKRGIRHIEAFFKVQRQQQLSFLRLFYKALAMNADSYSNWEFVSQ